MRVPGGGRPVVREPAGPGSGVFGAAAYSEA